MSLQQASSSKVAEETIIKKLFAQLSVMSKSETLVLI